MNINADIQNRVATTAQWNLSSRTTNRGELLINIDNWKFKIGDESSIFSVLDYVGGILRENPSGNVIYQHNDGSITNPVGGQEYIHSGGNPRYSSINNLRIIVDSDNDTTGSFVVGKGALNETDGNYVDLFEVDNEGNVTSFNGFVFDKTFPKEDPSTLEIYDGTGELWEMSSPLIVSNEGSTPPIWNAERNGNSGLGKIFSGISTQYFNGDGSYGILPIPLQNDDSIEFWVYPDWGLSPASTVFLLDNRNGVSNNDNVIVLVYRANNVFAFTARSTLADKIEITSDEITNLDQPFHVKLSWRATTNTTRFLLNGVAQTDITLSGSGIINMDLTVSDKLTFGSSDSMDYPSPNFEAKYWLCYFLHHKEYNIDNTYYNLGKQLISDNRKVSTNQNAYIDESGNFGAKNIGAENIFMNGSKIIDSGTSANGTYVKFADGTIFMEGIVTYNSDTTAAGSIYRTSSSAIVDFPYELITRQGSTMVTNDAPTVWTASLVTSTTQGQFNSFFHASLTGTRTAYWSVKGRWK